MKEYRIENLDCADCGSKIEDALKRLHTVRFASVNFPASKLFLSTDDMESVRRRIREIEPEVRITEIKGPDAGPDSFVKKRELAFLGASILLFVAAIAAGKKFGSGGYLHPAYGVFIAAYLLSGWKVLVRAVRTIARGQLFDENFLMACATIGAFAIRQPEEAVGVMLFFQVGELFQELALHHSRRSIKALLDIRPKLAHRKGENGALVDGPPEAVGVGEEIVVKPGEKIPLDGNVANGESSIDTSPLTGETVPRNVRPGDAVLAGMINMTGVLTVVVSKPFSQSSVSKILQMVEHSLEKKSGSEKFITRFARVYSPFVVGGALLVALLPPLLVEGALLSDWVYRALVLLVISCPCALVISIPLGFFGGIGRASRRGILVKGSNFLDALGSVRKVIFDKTGTLTQGVFKVTEVAPANGFSGEDVLRHAATAESHSEHPIARSILEFTGGLANAGEAGATEYREIPGNGIVARFGGRELIVGNDRLLHSEKIPHDTCCVEGTVVHVTVDRTYAGYIVIGDRLRDDAPETVRELRKLGVEKIGMLTGDNAHASEAVAEALGLDFVRSDLLPEQKVHALEEFMREGGGEGKTAFVGDGINDAPAIARADVGIAMGKVGSDAAVETADVVLMTDSPLKVAEAIEIARKTRRIVWQNILLAVTVKGVFVALGITGIATMWEAVFADMGVALAAIFNSIRILR